jgi:hypothetical protein
MGYAKRELSRPFWKPSAVRAAPLFQRSVRVYRLRVSAAAVDDRPWRFTGSVCGARVYAGGLVTRASDRAWDTARMPTAGRRGLNSLGRKEGVRREAMGGLLGAERGIDGLHGGECGC